MVRLIVAKSRNNVIGKDNRLVWDLPDDMKFFRDTTVGHTVVMGRKNWDSIPTKFRPLTGRVNVVLTRDSKFQATGCVVENDMKTALSRNAAGDIFIIGGGQIYRIALDLGVVDEMLVTEIDADVEGDTFFPDIDAAKWTKKILSSHAVDARHKYGFDFCSYLKI